MTLTHEDLATVQQMIATAIQHLPQSNQGKTINGTVQGYNKDVSSASVLIDGDALPVTLQSSLPTILAVGQRVVVTLQDPSGATITGLASPTNDLYTDWPNAAPESDFAASATAGPYTLGTYTAPVNGFGIAVVTAQGHFNSAGVQEVVMSSADGNLFSPGEFTCRAEGGTGFARTNLSGSFLKVLSRGDAWVPAIQFVVGGGTPTWHLNMYTAFIIFTPSPHQLGL